MLWWQFGKKKPLIWVCQSGFCFLFFIHFYYYVLILFLKCLSFFSIKLSNPFWKLKKVWKQLWFAFISFLKVVYDYFRYRTWHQSCLSRKKWWERMICETSLKKCIFEVRKQIGKKICKESDYYFTDWYGFFFVFSLASFEKGWKQG